MGTAGTDHLAFLHSNIVLGDPFPTGFTEIGLEDLGLFRNVFGCRLDIEHLVMVSIHQPIESLIPILVGCSSQDESDGLSILPVVEGKGVLSLHVEDQISLSHGASEENLNGIHPAGIPFGDADDFFIDAAFRFQQFQGIERSPETDGETTAAMAMKRDACVPKLKVFVLHGYSYRLISSCFFSKKRLRK